MNGIDPMKEEVRREQEESWSVNFCADLASDPDYEGLLLESFCLPAGTWRNVRELMTSHGLSWPADAPPMAKEIAVTWLKAPTMKGYSLLTFCVDTNTWAYFAIYNRERLLRIKDNKNGQNLS